MKLALCQFNPVVGDIDGNAARIVELYRQAENSGCDLAVFPELAVTGYPPEDLVLKESFVADNLAALAGIARATGECRLLVGFVDRVDGQAPAGRNAAAMCAGGEVIGVYHKRLLPNYGVFDEERLFQPGSGPYMIHEIGGVRVGTSICEDLWFAGGPVLDQALAGASLIVTINASPYSVGKFGERLSVMRERLDEIAGSGGERPVLAYVNQVGGQDELVFDGRSLVMGPGGEIRAMGACFEEDLVVVDLAGPAEEIGGEPGDEVGEVYEALVTGTRDYLRKNGFGEVVIGLSGGIDSSLVAVVAADAIGAEHVHGIAMPSRYSSDGSVSDARELASNLGIDLSVVPIEEAHRVFSAITSPVLGHDPEGLADENLQSRIRGVILMVVSNATGWLVLTTGNKSELAVGYSTLYGDTAGGFGVIKDVPKTLVYELSRYCNLAAGRELIPETVIEKPPSAELRPDQRDDQSLPPYDVLDPIVKSFVEENKSIDDIVASGGRLEEVSRIARLLDTAEYKRRQYPPGVKITARAFGKDWRVPITNRYRPHARRGPAPGGNGTGGPGSDGTGAEID